MPAPTLTQTEFTELMERFLNLQERPSEIDILRIFAPAIPENYNPGSDPAKHENDILYLLSLWDKRSRINSTIQSFFSKVAEILLQQGFEVVLSNYQLKVSKGSLQFSINAVVDISLVPESVPDWETGGFNNLPAAWWIEVENPESNFTRELLDSITTAAIEA